MLYGEANPKTTSLLLKIKRKKYTCGFVAVCVYIYFLDETFSFGKHIKSETEKAPYLVADWFRFGLADSSSVFQYFQALCVFHWRQTTYRKFSCGSGYKLGWKSWNVTLTCEQLLVLGQRSWAEKNAINSALCRNNNIVWQTSIKPSKSNYKVFSFSWSYKNLELNALSCYGTKKNKISFLIFLVCVLEWKMPTRHGFSLHFPCIIYWTTSLRLLGVRTEK